MGAGLGALSVVPVVEFATGPINLAAVRIPRIAQRIESIAGLADKLLPVLTKIKDLLDWILAKGKRLCEQIGAGASSLKQKAKDFFAWMTKKGDDAARAAPSKGELPDWLKRRFAEGEAFNKANRPRYKFNEVEVSVDGKKFRVDSYNPGKEIVSRRLTQFWDIQEKTAVGYFNEFTRKYAAGAEITCSPFNPKVLRGDRLRGDLIFEVPVQAKPIPQGVLDAATSRGITIRDVTGKVYN